MSIDPVSAVIGVFALLRSWFQRPSRSYRPRLNAGQDRVFRAIVAANGETERETGSPAGIMIMVGEVWVTGSKLNEYTRIDPGAQILSQLLDKGVLAHEKASSPDNLYITEAGRRNLEPSIRARLFRRFVYDDHADGSRTASE